MTPLAIPGSGSHSTAVEETNQYGKYNNNSQLVYIIQHAVASTYEYKLVLVH